MTDDLKYPIGRFAFDPATAPEQRDRWIAEIASLPQELEAVLTFLTDEQIDTPYRPEGWKVRQLVHHLADSHANAYIRIRLALTEDEPAVKGYDEKLWAELADSLTAPLAPSLQFLAGMHARWAALLSSLTPAQFERTLRHPDSGTGTVERYTGIYAWHGKHHVAHIRNLRERMGW